MTILQAIDDTRVFGQWLHAFDMTAWRAFHASIFGLPLDGAGLEIFRRCTGRSNPPTSKAAEVYAAIGRRGGKSSNVALLAVYHTCIDTAWRRFLAPGQRAVFPIISVDRQASRQVFDYCSGILHSSPLLQKLIKAEGKESIELETGAIIEVRTANYRSVRGPSYCGCCLDELAFFRDEQLASNPASEIVQAIRPAILEGCTIYGISTVYNKQGFFFEEHTRNFGQDDVDTLVWNAPTVLMNPGFNVKKIEKEKANDRAAALAEYESQWRDDLQALFSADLLDGVVIPDRGILPVAAEVGYTAACDMSGGRRDSSALCIAHRGGSGQVVIDFTQEIKAPHHPAEVVQEFSTILLAYGCHTVVGDRYGGEWPRDAFQKHGISYKISEQTASEAYLSLLPMFSNRSVELPDDQRLRSQFLSLMRKTSSGGRDTVVVSASASGHCDLSNAVALALASLGQAPMGSFVGMADGRGFLPESNFGGLERYERAIAGVDFD